MGFPWKIFINLFRKGGTHLCDKKRTHDLTVGIVWFCLPVSDACWKEGNVQISVRVTSIHTHVIEKCRSVLTKFSEIFHKFCTPRWPHQCAYYYNYLKGVRFCLHVRLCTPRQRPQITWIKHETLPLPVISMCSAYHRD